ncbi:hypothetical protein CTEN210_13162 [Chaetoceros tenuissimus]|uniref:Uncharacterized protein n=1 Tax=Chaetoceros tenuissimus TaxID=426638 RepID=A0AAD3HAZ0_9STRA|nr:hypothetical protein CTEN210_13162 [Chaetoceros tenuissimus]
MRVATVNGLVTLYYDGSRELYNHELEVELVRRMRVRDRTLESLESDQGLSDECKEYMKERLSWEQIVLCVTEIPERTFHGCRNIKRVIFANTVVRVGMHAFEDCESLVFVKWSIHLEYIGECAFSCCNLSSVFMTPSCREIRAMAFEGNRNLSIFHVPQDTELGINTLQRTAIGIASRVYPPSPPPNSPSPRPYPLRVKRIAIEPHVENGRSNYMNQWLKNMNNDEKFALHRACSSFQPLKEVIHTIIQEKGLKAFKEKNSAGISPSQYLKENPYCDLTEKEIIREYLMKAMGEVE